MKDYGYKVCYKQHGTEKLKLYVVTNTYDLAAWHIRWYENYLPPNVITDATWLILPIQTYAEYKRLWRNCPF